LPPPVATTLVANLPPVSTTPAVPEVASFLAMALLHHSVVGIFAVLVILLLLASFLFLVFLLILVFLLLLKYLIWLTFLLCLALMLL
jgi:hypothetical protein